jgi:hypothetical protein
MPMLETFPSGERDIRKNSAWAESRARSYKVFNVRCIAVNLPGWAGDANSWKGVWPKG